jgi:SAM-dependent methyltransferase
MNVKNIGNQNPEKVLDEQIYNDILKMDLLNVFKKHHNDDINPYYLDRSGRNKFAAKQLLETPINRILNLGSGGHRHLEESLGKDGLEVYEIDLGGDCDLKVNLDDLTQLPFNDKSFDVVCAFDVLEHLENFHLVNEEMFRVAKDYVLISLPNSASEIFFDAFWNRPQKQHETDRGVFSKFYGLPIVPPSDRHRWWLYFQDIIRFYYYFSQKNNAKLEFWTPRLSLKKKIFSSLFGAHIYYTYFCPFVWIKLDKQLSPGSDRS